MIKEYLVAKLQEKQLKECEKRFEKCSHDCLGCTLKQFTDLMIEELEDYY